MPGRPSNLISTNLPRPWSPQESSPSGKIPTVEPGIFFNLCLYWYLYVTESAGLLMFLTGLFVVYCT